MENQGFYFLHIVDAILLSCLIVSYGLSSFLVKDQLNLLLGNEY